MRLHHFLPHIHTIPLILTSALAGAALLYYATRQRISSLTNGDGVKNNLRALWKRDAERSAPTSGTFAQSTSNTGNASFDEYRQATLKKLEDEAAEFRAYLEGLRRTNDKGEFEEFLKNRKTNDPSSI